MKAADKAFHEALALPVPFVQVRNEEWRRPIREPYAPLMTWWWQRRSASKFFNYRIE
jgi:hypothetical protein